MASDTQAAAPSADSSSPPATPAGSDSPPAPPQAASPSPTKSPPQSSPPPPQSFPPPPQSSPPPPAAAADTPPPPSSSKDNPPSSTSPPPKGSSSSPPSPPKSSPSPPQSAVPSTTPPNAFPPPGPNAIPQSPPHSNESDGANGRSDGSNSETDRSSGSNLPMLVGVAIGVGLFAALVLVACMICIRKNKKKKDRQHDPSKGRYYQDASLPRWQNGIPGHMANGALPPSGATYSSDMSAPYSGPHGPVLPPPSPGVALGFNKSTFTYEELAAATNGFSQENLLGQGGFGYVHKGVLPNGKEIAVKQLKSGSGQGEREFQAEVEIISRVHHRHLVSLVGYCIAGHQRILVYEFVPNGTLEYHLYGQGLPTMDWPTRLKIAVGSAKGLAYLHEDCHPRIIHRDIKAANILVDNKFEAMVADFGLAKLSSDTNTHVSTRVMGTFGYLAPEYASSGKLTEKSDVFSFGVMLLELITGRRPVNHAQMEDSLVDWARPLITQPLTDEIVEELVDPRLENNYNTAEMARMVSCAAACIRHSARRRPRMSQIVRALEGDVSLDDLNEGVKPGQSSLFSSGSDYDSATYSSKMRQFRKVALGIESNDYSAPTEEYGLNDQSASGSSGEANAAGSNKGRPHRDF